MSIDEELWAETLAASKANVEQAFQEEPCPHVVDREVFLVPWSHGDASPRYDATDYIGLGVDKNQGRVVLSVDTALYDALKGIGSPGDADGAVTLSPEDAIALAAKLVRLAQTAGRM